MTDKPGWARANKAGLAGRYGWRPVGGSAVAADDGARPAGPGDRPPLPTGPVDEPAAVARPVGAPRPGTVRRPTESATRIALVYPELLGTYGDGGNALVLAQRLRWRGLPAEVVEVPAGEPVPDSCDVYLLGGGEDEPQVLAAEGMRLGGSLARAIDGGAAMLAVCAGYQVVGRSFPGSDGRVYDGVGLLDVETRRSFDGPGAPLPPRVVGDLVVDAGDTLGLPLLLGYENHGGRTRLVPGGVGRPLGTVRKGVGNGTPDNTDGLVAGRIVATYLHGPALAQNPALADLLLSWIHGELPPLDGPPETSQLRLVRRRTLDVA